MASDETIAAAEERLRRLASRKESASQIYPLDDALRVLEAVDKDRRTLADAWLTRSPDSVAVPRGTDLIAAERQRQIDVEGWTPEHDDHHSKGQMAFAADCYCHYAIRRIMGKPHLGYVPALWPWESIWWKPDVDPIRNLVKAGALIAAEIDRLQRAALLKETTYEKCDSDE